MSRICVLDYGSGNIKSVYNLFSTVSDQVVVSNEALEITRATHLILPGVGSFGGAIRKIKEKLPLDVLEQVVLNEKKPFLGICVGMQILATSGKEFGDHFGLGWIKGIVEKINSNDLPLPHIGWNSISSSLDSPLLYGLNKESEFYFVHSYAFSPENKRCVIANSVYGEKFCSVVQYENIFGVQFHPEKSQRAGIKLAKNFVALT